MMAAFVQSTNNNLTANKQTLDILLKAEKDKTLSKNLMSKLQNYDF
ncbi:MAG: hypothetical protein WCG25_05610 [bacterium]